MYRLSNIVTEFENVLEKAKHTLCDDTVKRVE